MKQLIFLMTLVVLIPSCNSTGRTTNEVRGTIPVTPTLEDIAPRFEEERAIVSSEVGFLTTSKDSWVLEGSLNGIALSATQALVVVGGYTGEETLRHAYALVSVDLKSGKRTVLRKDIGDVLNASPEGYRGAQLLAFSNIQTRMAIFSVSGGDAGVAGAEILALSLTGRDSAFMLARYSYEDCGDQQCTRAQSEMNARFESYSRWKAGLESNENFLRSESDLRGLLVSPEQRKKLYIPDFYIEQIPPGEPIER